MNVGMIKGFEMMIVKQEFVCDVIERKRNGFVSISMIET
jgi:hypothetical protein